MTQKDEALKMAIEFMEETATFVPHSFDLDGIVVVNACKAALSDETVTLPDGWVAVPVEPTDEMLMVGCEAGLDFKTLMDDEPFATDKAVYKAMIKPFIKNRS